VELAVGLDVLEQVRRDVPGRVDAVEAGGAKIRDLRVLGPDRLLQGVERLVDDLVGADLPGNSRALSRCGWTNSPRRPRQRGSLTAANPRNNITSPSSE